MSLCFFFFVFKTCCFCCDINFFTDKNFVFSTFEFVSFLVIVSNVKNSNTGIRTSLPLWYSKKNVASNKKPLNGFNSQIKQNYRRDSRAGTPQDRLSPHRGSQSMGPKSSREWYTKSSIETIYCSDTRAADANPVIGDKE